MGTNHGYTVKQAGDDIIDSNLNDIKAALDKLAATEPSARVYSFVTAGNNGGGFVALVPPKMPNGTQPIYRALAGMKLVIALDLSSNTSYQTSFEQVLSSNDQIRQLDTANLSVDTFLFVLQD